MNSPEGSNNMFSYTYHGTKPFSEPETKAVQLAIEYIIQDHGPNRLEILTIQHKARCYVKPLINPNRGRLFW